MAAGKPSTDEDVFARLAQKEPVRAEHRVSLDLASVEELHAARMAVTDAQQLLEVATAQTEALAQTKVAEAQRRLDAAEGKARDASVVLRFEGLPRLEFEALVDEHQPSEEQARKGLDYDPKTFPPALIAAACTSPKFRDAEHVLEVTKRWNAAEFDGLFLTARATCTRSRVVELGNG